MKAAENFRPADVTVWGITALVVWGVAILGANLSGLVPPSVYAALHASRAQASTLSQLRTDVAALGEDSARMKRENAELLQRFNLNEDSTGDITKRVGALEISIPKLVEQQLANLQPAIDTTATGSIDSTETGSIDTVPPEQLAAVEPAPIEATPPAGFAGPLTFEVDGGTVEVRQQPLRPDAPEVTFTPKPLANVLPADIAPDGSTLGIGLGGPVSEDAAEGAWQQLLGKAGTMLLGLSPILASTDGMDEKLLIAGPVTDRASALDLCQRLNNLSIPCQPLPYKGQALQLLGQRSFGSVLPP